MATLAEIQKESGEVLRQDTPNKLGGWKDDGHTVFSGERGVEAARNSPLEPAVDAGEGVKKFVDGEPGAEWSIGRALVGFFGGGVVGKAVGGGVKETAAGAAAGGFGTAAVDYAKQKYQESQQNKDKQKSDDGNKLKMDTPNLDNQPKDTPKGDDDGKSGWEQFWDNPVDFLKKQWDKLTGNDKDDNQSDNQLTKDTPNTDNNGKDPTGENNPDGSGADKPDGKGEESPNAGKDGEDGQGNGEDGGAGSGAGAGAGGGAGAGAGAGAGGGTNGGVSLPGAGNGFGAGLGGGSGAGTLDSGNPSAPVADPLLIGLEPNGNAHYGKDYATISVTSHTEENGGKWLDINGDGISNNVSWIAKGTGALFYDENNNGKLDGFNELLRDGVKTDNGEVTENGFDYVLKFLDTNGDKMLDAQDENFNKVKVLSLDEDNNEQVQSLQDLEIKSLDLNYQELANEKQYLYNLAGDNIVTQESTYTKENGEVGKLADVNLSYDTVNTQYINNIELTAEQAKVANLKGFGFVRDLNQAATQSEDLNKAIAEYSQLETKDEQLKYLDTLAKTWAETSPYYTNEKADIQGKEFYHMENSDGRFMSQSQANQMQKDLEDLDNNLNRFEKAAFETDETQNKLHILQQFYGQSDNAVYLEKPSDLGDVVDNIDKDYNAFGVDKKSNDFLLDCHDRTLSCLAMTHRKKCRFQAA
ncbi:MAG: hypothetical protein IJV35_04415 [Neisseriaceae bacterium]|nr:hypothetical protein [Neisseriaceae bacterium]